MKTQVEQLKIFSIRVFFSVLSDFTKQQQEKLANP